MSTKDKMQRKKYIGVCKGGLAVINKIIPRLLIRVTEQMDKNTAKRALCSSGWSLNPKRKNCVFTALFSTCILCRVPGGWNVSRVPMGMLIIILREATKENN